MDLKAATDIVYERQCAYLRGEMEQCEKDMVNSINPNATSDWDKMKLRIVVQRKKIKTQFLEILSVSVRKANCKKGKNWRPERANSTLKKQTRTIKRLGKKYMQAGCHMVQSWEDFMEECSVESKGL